VAVKKQQGGAKKQTKFTPRPCSTCGGDILELKDGTVVKLMWYSGGHRSHSWEWAHRKCIVTTGK
jgi:hypothetical protein